MATAKKDKAVPVALISASGIVIAAAIGYFATHQNKVEPTFLDYTVKVQDAKSHTPIVSAKVNLAEDQKAPQPYYTDSDGVVYVRLSKDTNTISLDVMAVGYQSQTRNGLMVHTGSQDFLLEPSPPQNLNPNSRPAETSAQPTATQRVSEGTRVQDVENSPYPEPVATAKKVEPPKAGLKSKSGGAASIKAANEGQKASDLSAKARWLLGKWTMYLEYGEGVKTCDMAHTVQGEMQIEVENGQIVGHLNASEEGRFPNTRYADDVCRDERRLYPDYSVSFSFLVVGIDAQSAKLTMTGEISCSKESTCRQLRKGYQEYGWQLNLRPDGKLEADFRCNPIPDGTYRR